MIRPIAFDIEDVETEQVQPLTVYAADNEGNSCVDISIETESGPVVVACVELVNGIPRLLVWADTGDQPTHIISLVEATRTPPLTIDTLTE